MSERRELRRIHSLVGKIFIATDKQDVVYLVGILWSRTTSSASHQQFAEYIDQWPQADNP